MKRLSERQNDHIKKLEDREKSLTAQKSLNEKEIKLLNSTTEKLKSDHVECTHTLSLTKIKLDSSSTQISTLKQSLHTQSEALEDSKYQNARLEEQLLKTRSSLAYYNNPALTSDDRNAKELEDYKLLLKCVCGLRFKSHCIMRCMHCFWYAFFEV